MGAIAEAAENRPRLPFATVINMIGFSYISRSLATQQHQLIALNSCYVKKGGLDAAF
jgi:hypothetical protein